MRRNQVGTRLRAIGVALAVAMLAVSTPYAATPAEAQVNAPTNTPANAPAGSTPPAQPTNPLITLLGNGSVTLNWQAPANNGGSPITAYLVEISPLCALCTGGLTTNTTTTINGLTNGVSYTFNVRAINLLGTSPTSLTVAGITIGTPTKSDNIRITNTADAQVALAWDQPLSVGANPIIGFNINPTPPCPLCSGLDSSSNSTVITGLDNGTAYTFDIRARNAIGISIFPSLGYATPSKTAGAPSGLGVTGTGNGTVDLGWTAPSDNGGAAVSGYTVTMNPACLLCTGLTSTGTNTTVGGLINGVSYTFTVKANNSAGASTASNPTSGTPSTTSTAPLLLVGAPTPNGHVALDWGAPLSSGGAPVTGYQVDISPPCAACTGLTTSSSNTVVAGLATGTVYRFAVRATNLNGVSDASNPSFVTPVTVPGAPTTPAITNRGNGYVSLNWTEPTNNGGTPILGYRVDMSPDCLLCLGRLSGNNVTTIVGLQNGTDYTFTVVAINAVGDSVASPGVSTKPATVPGQPTSVSATGAGSGALGLSWTPPSFDGGAPITGYRVLTSPPCSACSGLTSVGPSTTVGGLLNGITYAISIVPINSQGEGLGSFPIGATASTVPLAISNLSTTFVGDARVDLDWSAPLNGGSPITGYTIELDPPCVACSGKTTALSNTSITGLTNGTNYTFRVTTTNANGTSAPSNPVTAIPAGTPSAPNGLTVTSSANGEVALDWDEPTTNGGTPITGYSVQISPACVLCGGVSTTSETATTVTGLTNGVNYTFTVTANNARGASSASTSASSTPTTTASAVSGVTVTGTSNQQVALSWTPPQDTGGGSIVGYEISIDPGCAGCTGTSTTTTSTTVNGLTNGTPYRFSVRAITTSGTGDSSVEVSATPFTAPTAPRDPQALSVADGRTVLAWTPPLSNGGLPVVGYDIAVSPACTACTGLSSTLPTTTVTGLTNGTDYTFTVRARNTRGTTGPSASVSATPATTTTAPQSLTVASTDDETATLSWAAPSNTGGSPVTGYTVQVTPTCATCAGLATSGTGSTITGLTNGVTYSFTVTALNAQGVSNASATASGTPGALADAPGAPDADPAGDTTMFLSWDAPMDDGGHPITGYEVTLDPACPACTGLTTSSLSTTVAGLTPGVNYSFRVRALNVRGESNWSGTGVGVTTSAPTAPGGLTVGGADGGSVDLTWNAPTDNGGDIVTGYEILVLPSCSGCQGLEPSGTTTTITGLTNGVTYTFEVRAKNARGPSSYSLPAIATPSEEPDAPANLNVVTTGDRAVSLSWTAGDPNGSVPTGYTIVTNPPCPSCTGTNTILNGTTVSGLDNGTSYTFSVVANSNRGASDPSGTASASAFKRSLAPASITETAVSDGAVSLSWPTPADTGGFPVVRYEISVSPDCSGCTGLTPTGNTTTVGGLTNGRAYSFHVQAVTAKGAGEQTSSVSAIPSTTAGAPANVSVSGITDGRVDLTWQPPTSDGGAPVTGYVIDVNPACASCVGKTTTNSATTITGLTNGVSYTFAVRALNARGPSSQTWSTSAIPASTPSEPNNFAVAATGNRSLTLNWALPSNNGGMGITGYEVELSPACPGCTGLSATGTSTTIDGLANGQQYTMKLRATSGVGRGIATTEIVATPSTVPDAPTNVSRLNAGNGRVDLQWTAPSTNGGAPITGYRVVVSPPCTSCQGLTPNGTSTAVRGLQNGVDYTFAVEAINLSGSSSASPAVRAATAPTLAPVSPPKVLSRSANTVALAWSPPANAASEGVVGYRVMTSPPCQSCVGLESSETTTIITGLESSEVYTFWIVAMTEDGPGAMGVPARTQTFARTGPGYVTAGRDGGVYAFGSATFYGSMADRPLAAPVIGLEKTESDNGYWLVGADGGVFTFGDAQFYGSTGAQRLNAPIIGMHATPSGDGYWLLAADGGVFSFGDAQFFGSTGALPLNQPVVAMAPTPSGDGYWLVAQDGGVFAFGDASFNGSVAGGVNRPIVGIAADPDGSGYWLASDVGGVYTFGDAGFFGTTIALRLNKPIVGIGTTPGGKGYWLVGGDGGVFSFGDAPFYGSTGDRVISGDAVGMEALQFD